MWVFLSNYFLLILKDYFADDETRVKLLPVNEEEEPEADYINASYIKVSESDRIRWHLFFLNVQGYTGSVEYIATQGPLEHTVMDFWKMVIQENSSLIVMVAQFVEQNKVFSPKSTQII